MCLFTSEKLYVIHIFIFWNPYGRYNFNQFQTPFWVVLLLCFYKYDSLVTRLSWITHQLQWRHNGRDGVSHHRRIDCLFNALFRRRSQKTSKLRVTGLFVERNSSVTGEFPAQRASNGENVSIWWRRHGYNNTVNWNLMPRQWCSDLRTYVCVARRSPAWVTYANKAIKSPEAPLNNMD